MQSFGRAPVHVGVGGGVGEVAPGQIFSHSPPSMTQWAHSDVPSEHTSQVFGSAPEQVVGVGFDGGAGDFVAPPGQISTSHWPFSTTQWAHSLAPSAQTSQTSGKAPEHWEGEVISPSSEVGFVGSAPPHAASETDEDAMRANAARRTRLDCVFMMKVSVQSDRRLARLTRPTRSQSCKALSDHPMCRLVRDDQEKVIGVIFIALAMSFAREGTARGQAAAAEAGDGLHLDYRAPPACPDAAAFRAALSARNRRVAAGQRVAESVEVTVTESGGHARGRVVIRAAGKEIGTREVDGASCLEVVQALALVAALDLDAAPAAPRVHPPLPPDVHELPPEDPPPVPPPPRAPSWQLTVGAHASMMVGVADGLLFGAAVFVDFASASRDVFAPSVRVLFEGTVSGESQEKVGALRVTWFTGGLEACPIRLGSTVLHLRPCAGRGRGSHRLSGERKLRAQRGRSLAGRGRGLARRVGTYTLDLPRD
jgi:hypothetical protein